LSDYLLSPCFSGYLGEEETTFSEFVCGYDYWLDWESGLLTVDATTAFFQKMDERSSLWVKV
jgi:hypothetical protein